MRYVHNFVPERKNITFVSLDRERLWGEMWRSVIRSLDMMYDSKHLPFPENMDLGNEAGENEVKFRRFDEYQLFTLVKFWSSVYCNEFATRCLIHIFSRAKIGAYILYIDNNHSIFTQSFSRLVLGKWTTISVNGLEGHRFESEQKDQLKEYLPFFGNKQPLFSPKIRFIIFKKISM